MIKLKISFCKLKYKFRGIYDKSNNLKLAVLYGDYIPMYGNGAIKKAR